MSNIANNPYVTVLTVFLTGCGKIARSFFRIQLAEGKNLGFFS